MTTLSRSFSAGKMNKVVDERLIPNGEYIDALNIRMGSTEQSEIGVIENSKGNSLLVSLTYIDGTPLSAAARTIGAYADGMNETIYWFVHDPEFTVGATGKLDMIVSLNVFTNILTYHVISINDNSDSTTTLNFNSSYLITGINLIGDLLFFTDYYNQPRFINTTKNYRNPVLNIDGITDEELLVIKKPPTESPTLQPRVIEGEEDFLTTRFISFAYRYRYSDGEYSATSQWSQISFVPDNFNFSANSMLNEGMVNSCNAADITFNTGGELVVGIDLLFKESLSSIIKVIEKIDKQTAGYNDNELRTFTFINSKIFTILPATELLRLYDNVPRLAKAQTIMGNRLMYGNYIEGYDLIDSLGEQVYLEYTPRILSEVIGSSSISAETISSNYAINGAQTILDSSLRIDLTGKALIKGASISFEITLNHSSFSGFITPPIETTTNVTVDFKFYLSKDYASVYEMVNSDEFQTLVGTISNIQPVATACSGKTFTDSLNCGLPNNLGTYEKTLSGIYAFNQPVSFIASTSNNLIDIQPIAMQYVDSVIPTQIVYEYYKITAFSASYQEIANPTSLHSNRGYEIGIVYMDEYNRSTTTLVSPNNTVYIPCGSSDTKNSILIDIPPAQKPPYWATRYKFVIQPDEENYEVIYTNLFFQDPNTNEVWFLLEGENAKKIETGDRLIVKADSDGPLDTCVYATVLEKESKAEAFITPLSGATVPSGVYMKINPNSFSAASTPDAVFAPGRIQQCTTSTNGAYAIFGYVMNIKREVGFDPLNPTWEYEDYTIPAGSKIKWFTDWNRNGHGSACEKRGFLADADFISSESYDNVVDWFNGENAAAVLMDGYSKDGGTTLVYIPTIGIMSPSLPNFTTLYIQWYRSPVTNQLILQLSTGLSCSGRNFPNDRKYCVTTDIQVFRAIDNIIFETEPTDALPDVFFENNLSFPIQDGFHVGNIATQTDTTSATIDTEFFNCFAFGNGAESYKIRDSIAGRSFNLGERVTSVSAQDYKMADRFAGITYSGIYNAESNLNKLNEFNLGVANFKNLEVSFGPIYIMDSRRTDILVLQEDKISYVLAGKNLLSDAAGGDVLTSVPEVLGTQIARTEKYGISFNPESYVHWGYDRYFTDSKRGVVLNLKGDEASSEQLTVVSEFSMRTWFRDLFNASFNTQKLGGYDPYMNEYVLSSNDIAIPSPTSCLSCGVTQQFLLNASNVIQYCVDLSQLVGDVTVSYEIISIDEGVEITVDADYNATPYSSGATSVSGSFVVNKDSQTVLSTNITLSATGSATIQLTVSCPVPQALTIIEIVITNNSDTGKTTHTQYRYTSDTYTSPIQTNAITFVSGTSNPLISSYILRDGFIGSGSFPTVGSSMRMISNKFSTDTFTFNSASNFFKYHTSDILYGDTSVEVQTLLSLSSMLLSEGGPSVWYGDFVVPTLNNYLYLIWDLRTPNPVYLCYDVADRFSICCDCTTVYCHNWVLVRYAETAEATYTDCNGVVQVVTLNSSNANPFYPPICVRDGALNEPVFTIPESGGMDRYEICN